MNDNRPIRGNGAYDLNFVDWQNEWERVLDENPGFTVEHPELDEAEALEQELKFKQLLKKLTPMKIGKSNQNCSICFTNFETGSKIFKLPCGHIFHCDCFEPWAKKNMNCPNCRASL